MHDVRQCRGKTKSDGAPCRIAWELNSAGYCKYHAHQDETNKSDLRCRGKKPDGTRCGIRWGLNADSLCPNHEAQAPVAAAADNNSQHPTPTQAKRGSTSSGSEASSATGSSAVFPPLWSMRYIPSTGAIVLRLYSEYSWRCPHDPFVLWIPQWSRHGCAVRCLLALGKLLPIPGLADVIDGEKEVVERQVAVTKDLMDMLNDMKILRSKDKLYSSNPEVDGGDHSRLEVVRECLDGIKNTRFIHMTKLHLVPKAAIWVAESELKNPEIKRAKPMPKPKAIAKLLFERITGWPAWVPRHRSALIRWWVRLPVQGASPQLIDEGAACVDEPVPVVSRIPDVPVDIADCVVEIEIETANHRRGRDENIKLEGSVGLQQVTPVSEHDIRSAKNLGADAPAAWPIFVGSSRVHFHLLEVETPASGNEAA